MNYWTKRSIYLSGNSNYLELLYEVYPVSLANPRRELLPEQIEAIRTAYDNHDDSQLLNSLLDLDIFPIKNSYVAYLRRDRGAISRNPRIAESIIYELYRLGIDEILNRCTAPKESNRQMSELFKQWIGSGAIGLPVVNDPEEFLRRDDNCILNESDQVNRDFAAKYLGFRRNKGVDFLAKFHNKYVAGEAKFLSEIGGNQNNQFADAVQSMHSFSGSRFPVIPIAILDGVLYFPNSSKIYKYLNNNPQDNIMSALLLREFLYSL